MTEQDHSGASILTISVGNTNTSAAAFCGGELLERISRPNTDTLADAIHKLTHDHAIDIAVMATVNRPVSTRLAAEIQSVDALQLLQVGEDLGIPLKHTLEDEAIRLTGQDRLLNAVAAHSIARQACVVVDAGTAITVDFVDGEGVFHGGAIAPGVRMSLAVLHDRTAALPEVSFAAPEADIPFARNTAEAMLHGVYYGARGLVRQLVERYAEAYEAYPVIIATGGDAKTLFESDPLIERIVPDLTLQGIAKAYAVAIDEADEDDPA